MGFELISRDDAHKTGKRHFYTGKSCIRGHVGPRFVSSGGCVQCQNFKALPTANAPNAGMPPTPYVFPSATQVTPAMLSFVHARVLRLIPDLAREYEALRGTLTLPDTIPVTLEAVAVLRAYDEAQSPAAAQAARAARETRYSGTALIPDGYEMTEKAGRLSYGIMVKGDWTDVALMDAGYMRKIVT